MANTISVFFAKNNDIILNITGLNDNINKIDENISNFLNMYNNDDKLSNSATNLIIFCYKKKLYLVLHYLIKHMIYKRYTYEIWYATRTMDIKKIIAHAYSINNNFKIDTSILIYQDREVIPSLLQFINLSELIIWHNDNYWYIYGIQVITEFIKAKLS